MWILLRLLAPMLSAIRLWGAAVAMPDTRPVAATEFAIAAELEQTPRVPAELLVALGWPESRFEATVRTGVCCGAMQVNPLDLGEPWESSCAAWTSSTRAGVRAGVREIEMMLAEPRVHGDLRIALLYRACGGTAFTGTCSAAKRWWVESVLTRFFELAARSDVHERWW